MMGRSNLIFISLYILCALICFGFGKSINVKEEELLQQTGTITHRVGLESFEDVISRAPDQTFRLYTYYDASVTTELPSDTRNRIQKTIVPQLKNFFESALMVRPTMKPILLQRDCAGGTYYPTNVNNTRRCAATCASVTMCGQTAVPQDHLKQCVECNGNSFSCQPVGTAGSGVSNTDMILYVSAINTDTCGNGGGGGASTVAYAGTCQMEGSLDRPIAGSVNFCPSAFNGATDDFILSVAKHEIIHALAFSTSLYAFWRDENGNPRTPRDSNGFPQQRYSTGEYVWSDSTITQVTYNDWMVYGGTTSHTVNIVVTPTVVAEGKRQFGCTSLKGVQLEDQGGSGTAMSHWEKRILGNEIMTGVVDDNTVLSRITLALMEDSGWYKVDYKYGEYLDWGNNVGCTLPTKSCYQYMNERINGGEPITPFCVEFGSSSSGSRFGCTDDRKYKSQCNLATYTSSLPRQYQYFSNPAEGGGTQIADFCPYQRSFKYTNGRTTECSVASNQPADNQDFDAETYGSDSKCFNHASQWHLGINNGPPISSGCYKYSCNSDDSVVTIFVRGTPYACKSPGQNITIDVASNGFGRYRGKMLCPFSFSDVCEETNN